MIGHEEMREIERFVYEEARLADESRYADWEALWEPDGTYWVPLGEGDFDRERDLSIVNDTRARLASRVRQLQTGKHFAQVPASFMRRLVTNLEAKRLSEREVEVSGNFLCLELAIQSTREQRLWGGRVLYRLRRREAGYGIFHKKVTLVNGSEPLPNLPFLV